MSSYLFLITISVSLFLMAAVTAGEEASENKGSPLSQILEAFTNVSNKITDIVVHHVPPAVMNILDRLKNKTEQVHSAVLASLPKDSTNNFLQALEDQIEKVKKTVKSA